MQTGINITKYELCFCLIVNMARCSVEPAITVNYLIQQTDSGAAENNQIDHESKQPVLKPLTTASLRSFTPNLHRSQFWRAFLVKEERSYGTFLPLYMRRQK